MTLFMDPTGPLLRYADGALSIEDLNPEIKTKWKMSRGKMFKLGCRCIWAAVAGARP